MGHNNQNSEERMWELTGGYVGWIFEIDLYVDRRVAQVVG